MKQTSKRLHMLVKFPVSEFTRQMLYGIYVCDTGELILFSGFKLIIKEGRPPTAQLDKDPSFKLDLTFQVRQ